MHLIDHRSEISRLFRKAMIRHGLTRKVVQNNQIKHVFSHGYRKSRQIFGVCGDMYCPELWAVIGSPAFKDGPIFQYMAGKVIHMPEVVFDLKEELDISFIESHFELIVSKAIAPLVHSIQTPVEAVQFAYQNPAVLLGAPSVCVRRLRQWYAYYGLPFEMPEWAKPDEDDEIYPFA